MTSAGFTETIAVGGIDIDAPRRSCLSLCRCETDQRAKVEMVFQKRPTFVAVSWVESQMNRARPQSTGTGVRGDSPELVPERYSETCYVRPQPPRTSFISYLDVGNDDNFRRKWFSSEVRLEPKTVSSTVVGDFKWLLDDWTDVSTSSSSSSSSSSDDDD